MKKRIHVCAVALCTGAAVAGYLCGAPAARGQVAAEYEATESSAAPQTGERLGAADPRDEGSAEGY